MPTNYSPRRTHKPSTASTLLTPSTSRGRFSGPATGGKKPMAGKSKKPGPPVRKVQDPFNPMVSYWVDKDGNRTSAPSGGSGKASAGTLGVGSGSPLTRTSVASPNRSASSRISGFKKGMYEGANTVSPVSLDVLTGKREADAMDAAILAASLVPVPGLKGIAKAGKAGAKAGRAAEKATGKTGRAVAKDASTAAARRTPKESKTIAAGTRRGRSAAKAIELEKQGAKSSSSKSVNEGPKSPVQPRTPSTGTVPKGITKKRQAEFAATRGKRPAFQPTGKAKRTPAQAKRAQADLEESLKRGSELRAAGRAPGEDIPGSTGRGIYEPKPTPATPPKVQARDTVSKALTKPRNPGKNASAAKKAKYEKDLAAWEKRQADMKSKTKAIDEGRLKVDGTPKGATAKSIRRQESKRAKNKAAVDKPASKPKKPSAKSSTKPKPGNAVAVARPSAGSADRATANGALTRRGGEVIQGRVIKGGRTSGARTREPIDLKTRPVGGERPAIGRPGNVPARRAKPPARTGTATKRPIAAIEAGTKPKGTAAAAAAGKKRGKKGLIAAGILGGTAAAGLVAKQFDSDKSPNDKAATPAGSKKDFKDKDWVLDNAGRRISRAEFERRKAWRKKNGLEIKAGESRPEYRKRLEAWKKANKKKTAAETKRRNAFRSGEGKAKFGDLATYKTREQSRRRANERRAS